MVVFLGIALSQAERVLGAVDDGRELIEFHVECRRCRPGCPECGVIAQPKGILAESDLRPAAKPAHPDQRST